VVVASYLRFFFLNLDNSWDNIGIVYVY